MNSLDKFKRHIGEPVKIKIGEDEFEFKPLNYEQFGKLMVLTSKFKQGEEFDMSTLGEENIKGMLDLFYNIVNDSYPELTDEMAKQFVTNNINIFGDILEKLTPKTEKGRETLIKDKIKSIQDARDKRKD